MPEKSGCPYAICPRSIGGELCAVEDVLKREPTEYTAYNIVESAGERFAECPDQAEMVEKYRENVEKARQMLKR